MRKTIMLDIPDGKYCGRCIFLEAGCSSAYDYCRLFPKDHAKDEDGNIIKHKDCPSLQQPKEATPTVSICEGMDEK